jgi:hypothetical protein
MNRILNINADDFTCLVEPGVTFYALHDELVKRGLDDKMWIDTPDLSGGSVIRGWRLCYRVLMKIAMSKF